MHQSHVIETLPSQTRAAQTQPREARAPETPVRAHSRRPRLFSRLRATVALCIAVAVLVSGACSQKESSLPDDADPQLQTGERIWLQRCANCHGLEGDGGIGPKLADGEVAKKYEDPGAEKSVIQNGLNGNEMPAFKDILSDEEIDAVVAYTRDAL